MRSVKNILRKAWLMARARAMEGFLFGRPLVVLQSDDWGRVGIRDREAWEELRSLGVNLGERNYDFYSLETAEDIEAIVALLSQHRDSKGRPPCLGMNFMMANVDFAKVIADEFRQIHLRSLADGLPDGWKRPGLFEAYRQGISAGILSPALHGTTHFCRLAAERYLNDGEERGSYLRMLWRAGVPYIYWRMPWMGFEYSDPGKKRQGNFPEFRNAKWNDCRCCEDIQTACSRRLRAQLALRVIALIGARIMRGQNVAFKWRRTDRGAICRLILRRMAIRIATRTFYICIAHWTSSHRQTQLFLWKPAFEWQTTTSHAVSPRSFPCIPSIFIQPSRISAARR